MRLAQLARKISVKASEITEFLDAQGIQLENNSNAKVMDEHVELVFTHFASELIGEDDASMPELPSEPEAKVPEAEGEGFSQKAEEVETINDVVTPEEAVDTHEVIKPVKVELPGLKVVGKIDLPEPKKKEGKLPEDNEGSIEKDENSTETISQSSRSGTGRARPKREYDRRPRKNPIALQREREEREALKRKLEQREKEKELRTKRYLKKVKVKSNPPKPLKKMKNDEEYETYSEVTAKPKSFIGKILNWFVSE